MVIDYNIPREVAQLIAVGLLNDVGAWVAALKSDNPDEYQRFAAEAKQAQSAAPIKRRRTRNRAIATR